MMDLGIHNDDQSVQTEQTDGAVDGAANQHNLEVTELDIINKDYGGKRNAGGRATN